jgi:hypothetical protein
MGIQRQRAILTKVQAREYSPKARRKEQRAWNRKAARFRVRAAKRLEDARLKNRIKRLEHAGKKRRRRFSILRDTGVLMNALQPTASLRPGGIEDHQVNGVAVGYGGPAPHPGRRGPTIAQIAQWHDTGAGRLPRREIIVAPDARTLDLMRRDLEEAVRSLIAKAVK